MGVSQYNEFESKDSKAWHWPTPQQLNFDVDKYLNRICAQNQAKRLPAPIARFLGYRKEPAKEVGNILIALWAMVGAFIGLIVVGAVYRYGGGIADLHPPVIFASLGATAILDYNTIQSPLGQPRAAICGHLISVVTGVGLGKLFMLRADFESIRWIAGALACGVSSALMTLTNTVHPPGGATAVLAIVTPEIVALGWYFVPLIILGSALMLGVALIVNNIQRQFPVFWWTPRDVSRPKLEDDMLAVQQDVEASAATVPSVTNRGNTKTTAEGPIDFHATGDFEIIALGPHGIKLPDGFTLGTEERNVLEVLSERLRERTEAHGFNGRQFIAHSISHSRSSYDDDSDSKDKDSRSDSKSTISRHSSDSGDLGR